jgi:elongation factor G
MNFPEPVIFIAVEPKTQADMGKLTKVLEQLQDEDPTVKVKIDPDTGQMILSGMGELHLEILIDRMKNEFGVDARIGKPQVAYRETITKASKAEGSFDKVISNAQNYAKVKVEVFPENSASTSEFSFVNALSNDVPILKSQIEAIKNGIKSGIESGPIAGFPLTSIGVRLIEADINEETATDLAFRIATANAVSLALRESDPALLEPVMKIEVVIPEFSVGDIISDLGSRGASIEGIDQKSDMKLIHAFCPLSEMFGYTTTLRSLTQGRGTYSMVFDSFRRLPAQREEKVLKAMRGY